MQRKVEKFMKKSPSLARFPNFSCILVGTVQGLRNVLEMEFNEYEWRKTVNTQAF